MSDRWGDYTPGPWTVAGVLNSEPRCIIAEGIGAVVGCTLTQDGTQTTAHGGVYKLADARLISKVYLIPRLEEALEALAQSPIAFEDDRIEYVEAQVYKSDIETALALLDELRQP